MAKNVAANFLVNFNHMIDDCTETIYEFVVLMKKTNCETYSTKAIN